MNRRTAEGVHSPGQVGVITVLLFVQESSLSLCVGEESKVSTHPQIRHGLHSIVVFYTSRVCHREQEYS